MDMLTSVQVAKGQRCGKPFRCLI